MGAWPQSSSKVLKWHSCLFFIFMLFHCKNHFSALNIHFCCFMGSHNFLIPNSHLIKIMFNKWLYWIFLFYCLLWSIKFNNTLCSLQYITSNMFVAPTSIKYKKPSLKNLTITRFKRLKLPSMLSPIRARINRT